MCALLPSAAAVVGQPGGPCIGRKLERDLTPADFRLAVRALHLPPATRLSLGIKFVRLLCAGADYVEARQRQGLRSIIDNSKLALSHASGGRLVHLSYSHLWDEVQVKFNGSKRDKLRATKAATLTQTIVQRGAVSCLLANTEKSTAMSFGEYWLCRPLEVQGTDAASIMPALRRSMPTDLLMDDLSAMKKIVESCSSFTFAPLCDKATGNMLLLRRWGEWWERNLVDQFKGAIWFWPDVCGIHIHHRGKMQVKSLKEHLTRHFSIANLYKQQHIKVSMEEKLESLIAGKGIKRIIGPPPEGVLTLSTLVDVLFDMDADFHRRSSGHSQRHTDLSELCKLVNCDMKGEWCHHCWDPETSRPCCANVELMNDKIYVAASHALLAASDRIPAESRWTHLVGNLKQTLLRRLLFRVGTDCFSADAADAPAPLDPDGEAHANHFKVLQGVRSRKAVEYYKNDRNMHEICVLAMCLEVCDASMLYALLGDPLPSSPGDRSKLDKCLDKHDSVLGKCVSGLLNLMEGWSVEDSTRRPWCLLDALEAPVHDPDFKKWSRSQILRLAAAMFRRHESRLAQFPYRLFDLFSPSASDADRDKVCDDLLRAPRDHLDTYSLGVRTLHPTKESLMSWACTCRLKADFTSHSWGTDFIERLNAELTSRHPRRGASRSFVHSSRESVLRQVATVHQHHGGAHPLSKKSFSPSLNQEVITHSSLLPVHSSAALGDEAVAASGGRGVARMGGGGQQPPTASSSTAIVLAERPFEEPVTVQRPNPGLVLVDFATRPDPLVKQKRGLSHFMLERNRYVHQVREAKGETLGPSEIKEAHERFRVLWGNMDHEVHGELYQEWRNEVKPDTVVKAAYRPVWSGGCSSVPITKEELCAHVRANGWPSDSEVYEKGHQISTVIRDATVSGDASSTYNLWGIGRQARNSARRNGAHAMAFDLIEKGIVRYLEVIGRPVADQGDVMLMVEGPALARPGGTDRVPFVVSGTCWSPKVFDACRLEFRNEGDRYSENLVLPFVLKISDRACLVSGDYKAMFMQTSDELIENLVTTFGAMTLRRLTEEPADIDGSLRWSRVTGVEDLGCLWRVGLRQPLDTRSARSEGHDERPRGQRLFGTLMDDDPFSDAAEKKIMHMREKRKGAPGGQRQARRKRAVAEPAVSVGAEALGDLDRDLQQDRHEEPEGGEPAAIEEGTAPLEMDLYDDEVDHLSDYLAEELEAIYTSDLEESPAALERRDREDHAVPADAEPDGEAVAAILSGVQAASDDLGLEAMPATPIGSSSSSSAPVVQAAVADPPPPLPNPGHPWELLSDMSSSGYMSFQGRVVMRIQRGKPKHSVTVNCYRHTACKILLSESRCPSDLELKKWLFEVDPAQPGAAADSKSLGKEHSGIGYQKWGARKRR